MLRSRQGDAGGIRLWPSRGERRPAKEEAGGIRRLRSRVVLHHTCDQEEVYSLPVLIHQVPYIHISESKLSTRQCFLDHGVRLNGVLPRSGEEPDRLDDPPDELGGITADYGRWHVETERVGPPVCQCAVRPGCIQDGIEVEQHECDPILSRISLRSEVYPVHPRRIVSRQVGHADLFQGVQDSHIQQVLDGRHTPPSGGEGGVGCYFFYPFPTPRGPGPRDVELV